MGKKMRAKVERESVGEMNSSKLEENKGAKNLSQTHEDLHSLLKIILEQRMEAADTSLANHVRALHLVQLEHT